ncbi:MAG TPA: GTPase HflX [Candidatus Kapabacteria bacterium]|nr:GTPase HflX [Candidatus Kapabacteria bacterium]
MKENFQFFETNKPRERAGLVSLITQTDAAGRLTASEHLNELALLADTAGADVLFRMTQERAKPDGALYLGKGKVEELATHVEMLGLQMVIFDDDLSPVQIRNLERELKVKILDRSALILDIFASRARTREAKTQIELAQLEYMLPRLTRAWTHLSKQYGGIGTKGPGETQIETDRRIVRTRITHLKEKLHDIEQQQQTRRAGRNNELTRVALVGYTNVGKSSLLNVFAADKNANVFVENRLFATLDATTRSVDLSHGRKALVTDTVGFIRKLPTKLVASFRTTLSEAEEADILLHVVDISHPQFEEQIETVKATLKELNVDEKPVIMVFNKIDQLDSVEDTSAGRGLMASLCERYPHAVFISAERGIGINQLREEIEKVITEDSFEITVEIPLEHYEIASRLHELGEVVERIYNDTNVRLKLRVHSRNRERVDRLLANAA